ncbi:MAG TPA: Arm DNA-binding domain-containing protein, partial [Chloroflexota bacterium]|nr:Arm DNA-binding domain-containing protein [Chloroflexota bacterium]
MAGSLTKHTGPDRKVTWRARVDAGIDPVTRKRKQVMASFPTKKEAELWVAAQATARSEGIRIDSGKQTYSAFLQEWLDGPASRRLHPNSVRCYATLIHARIAPALGQMKVKELTTAALERFLHAQEATASPATIRTLGAILRRSLRDAERLGLRGNNPALLVDGPRVPKQEVTAWGEADARHFLVAIAAEPDYALWRLLLTSGMRIGEALALRWSDLDL